VEILKAALIGILLGAAAAALVAFVILPALGK
jgi:hypothetical protein